MSYVFPQRYEWRVACPGSPDMHYNFHYYSSERIARAELTLARLHFPNNTFRLERRVPAKWDVVDEQKEATHD